MCDTVIKNTRDAQDYLETQYPKADQVTFAYYMGRIFLAQRRMRKVNRMPKPFLLSVTMTDAGV
jgi:hypothetical protein